ncbi:MAG: uroporphyrinogen-III synthase [Gemmataceae bacterium]
MPAWLRDLCADRFSHVVLLTGEGAPLTRIRRARRPRRCDRRPGRTRLITAGPKPGQAANWAGAIPCRPGPDHRRRRRDTARACRWPETIGVQLYVEENAPLSAYLASAGATMAAVLPYVYAPAADSERLIELIEGMRLGRVDALVFTSSPQVDRLFEVAGERGLVAPLQEGLKKTRVAAVGPIVAETLRRRGAPVDICPEQGFVMKNLVNQLREGLGRR